jgi:uncharacterized protein YecE (DUF72 family)
MEFGKTPFFKEVDFTLPKEIHILDSFSSDRVNLFLGTPQWNQKEWIGRIYPKGTKGSDTLRLYSERFNGIELNSTHYALPSQDRVQTWKECTTPDFKFSPKISQRISHYGLKNIKEELDLFLKTVMGFQEKLGLSFIQLPPEFSVSDYSALKNFLDLLPQDFKLAIEFRNPSFFNHGLLQNKVFDLLSKQKVSTVITDTAGRRDVLHSSLTTDKVILRFVGNDHSQSDTRRLEDWIIRIGSFYEQGLKDFYFFAHAPNNIHSIDLAQKYALMMNNEHCTDIMDPLSKELDEIVQISLL